MRIIRIFLCLLRLCLFVQIQKSLVELSSALKKLEIDICAASIAAEENHGSDEYDDAAANAMKTSAAARHQLASAAGSAREELSRHLLKNNTAERGIITWLKPGVSLDVKPKLLHLLEVMSYLQDNEDYISTGYHLYDFYQEDIDVQYSKICDILFDKCQPTSSGAPRKLSCPSYEKLKTLCFPEGVPDDVNCAHFLERVRLITSASKAVLRDVSDKKLNVSFHNRDGKNALIISLHIYCY